VLPYALVRPALRKQLGERELTSIERRMLSSIETRVIEWRGIDRYYEDDVHARASRATESVLNAVILAQYEAESSHPSQIARRAFDEAWALQLNEGPESGGWEWLNFHEAPWESSESGYQGAAMIALALGLEPADYQNESPVREHVLSLRAYLSRGYDEQPFMNQLYVMWAAARIPGLITEARKLRLKDEVRRLQNPDGGWSLASLDEQKSLRHSAFDLLKLVNGANGSDGCATGLTVLALEEGGMAADDPMLRRGLQWLERHQFEDGSWWASSMNVFRDAASDTGRFMSDAATGYATLALERSVSLRNPDVQTVTDR